MRHRGHLRRAFGDGAICEPSLFIAAALATMSDRRRKAVTPATRRFVAIWRDLKVSSARQMLVHD
jgi:hypothetical protein